MEIDRDHASTMIVADIAYGGDRTTPSPILTNARHAMVNADAGVVIAGLATDPTPIGSGLYHDRNSVSAR